MESFFSGGLDQVAERFFDTRLARAIREGTTALSDDLGELRGYLRTIDEMLEEKARDLEASWAVARETATEIETLQALEQTVVEQVITVAAGSLGEVRTKLAIWRAVASGSEDDNLRSPLSRLVLSIERDIERLEDVRASRQA